MIVKNITGNVILIDDILPNIVLQPGELEFINDDFAQQSQLLNDKIVAGEIEVKSGVFTGLVQPTQPIERPATLDEVYEWVRSQDTGVKFVNENITGAINDDIVVEVEIVNGHGVRDIFADDVKIKLESSVALDIVNDILVSRKGLIRFYIKSTSAIEGDLSLVVLDKGKAPALSILNTCHIIIQ